MLEDQYLVSKNSNGSSGADSDDYVRFFINSKLYQSGKSDHKGRLLYQQNNKLEGAIAIGRDAENMARDTKINLAG